MIVSEEAVNNISEINNEPEWMKKIRLNSWKIAKETEIQIKDDEWKYTYISGIDFNKLQLNKSSKKEFYMDDKDIIFSDMRTALKENEDILKKYFSKIAKIEDKLTALNTALWNNGYFIYVPNGVNANKVKISFIFDNNNDFIRNLIVLEENSSLTLFEDFSQNQKDQNTILNVTEIIIENNSKMKYFSFQNLSRKSYEFSTKKCILKKNSEIDWIFGYFGGKLSKLKIETLFTDEGAISKNTGIFFGSENQHFNITTNAMHISPNTINNILVHGALKDKATSAYFGMINIDKFAQKTDSYLADKTLLLSGDALANSIPSLKIEANDVRATHGVTVSQIDDEQLFYLMSRGLTQEEAEMMIVEGFFEPVINKIEKEDIKQKIQKIVQERMINA